MNWYEGAMAARRVLGIFVLLFSLWVAWHLYSAQSTRNNPPLECILAGGTWNIWNGWSCN